MFAVRAVKFGFRWKIGNGQKVKFWKDNWLGSSSLAIQFWDLYILVNEKTKAVADLWDGESLKCTFRRSFDGVLYQAWLEVIQLAYTIRLSDEEDELIWQFNSNGVYSSQSLYKIINFRGIQQVHFSGLWGLKIPPRELGTSAEEDLETWGNWKLLCPEMKQSELSDALEELKRRSTSEVIFL
ncbi:hypothetical protein BS78_06G071300 [Paspalum vaginatum]|nr:hypothetical protein BS78_06G071300 [Paspalum vaginatum]